MAVVSTCPVSRCEGHEPTMMELIDALREMGVTEEVEHTKMGPWMKWAGDDYDYVLLPVGRYVAVGPLDGEAEDGQA